MLDKQNFPAACQDYPEYYQRELGAALANMKVPFKRALQHSNWLETRKLIGSNVLFFLRH